MEAGRLKTAAAHKKRSQAALEDTKEWQARQGVHWSCTGPKIMANGKLHMAIE
jgi:hypothetical protein